MSVKPKSLAKPAQGRAKPRKVCWAVRTAFMVPASVTTGLFYWGVYPTPVPCVPSSLSEHLVYVYRTCVCQRDDPKAAYRARQNELKLRKKKKQLERDRVREARCAWIFFWHVLRGHVLSMCGACVEHVWSMCGACVEHVV
jgi:hypothetical protein